MVMTRNWHRSDCFLTSWDPKREGKCYLTNQSFWCIGVRKQWGCILSLHKLCCPKNPSLFELKLTIRIPKSQEASVHFRALAKSSSTWAWAASRPILFSQCTALHIELLSSIVVFIHVSLQFPCGKSSGTQHFFGFPVSPRILSWVHLREFAQTQLLVVDRLFGGEMIQHWNKVAAQTLSVD